MVKEIEVQKIVQHITEGNSFLLSGGAGSGKTYSLVSVIEEVIALYPFAKIACMTYTNSAVKEIENRITHENLSVTTIHDFLWDIISPYQRDLKNALVAIVNDEEYKKTKNPEDAPLSSDYFDQLEDAIRYRQSSRIRDGIISHDTVIELAEYMFSKHRKLCDILKDKYKFIFVDEYQDTNPRVIKLLLSHLKKSNKHNVIGLFGDAMQAIYDDGVGDVKSFINTGDIIEVPKLQNRRNPQKVMDLANTLRTDGIIQKPSEDEDAPNMHEGQIKQGVVKFIYSDSDDLNYIKEKIGWNFEDVRQTKELNLTHNLIAGKAGFGSLMAIYDDDPVFKLKEEVRSALKEAQNTADPIELGEHDTFEEVLNLLKLTDRTGTLKKKILQDEHPDLYDLAKGIKYTELSKLYLNKDSLIDDKKDSAEEENRTGSKRDALVKHLVQLYNNIVLYKSKKYNEFIRTTHFHIQRLEDKKKLKDVIDRLCETERLSIGEAIDFAHSNGICYKGDSFVKYAENYSYAYARVRAVPFQEFISLYNYLEGHTPFSTQHKIKGAQFDNVLVILDKGGWNKYNFEYLLDPKIFGTLTAAKKKSFPAILNRTQKIFYVCCTRAKENLVVFYQSPSPEVISYAKTLFNGNILQI